MKLKKTIKVVQIGKKGLGINIPKVFGEILELEIGEKIEVECFVEGDKKIIILKNNNIKR